MRNIQKYQQWMNSAMSLTMLANMGAPIIAFAVDDNNVSQKSTGTIDTNIIFENQDTTESVMSRNISLNLYRGSTMIGTVELDNSPGSIGGYPLEISTKETSNNSNNQMLFGAYAIKISNLEQGDYRISLSGNNHTDYTSDIISIDDTSKVVNISTNSKSFTYGDLNGDNIVDQADLEILEADIKSESHSNDLTGDGIVDIVDLALVQLNISNPNMATILSGAIINQLEKIDVDTTIEALEKEVVIESGSVEQIFQAGNTEVLTLTPVDNTEISEETPIVIPIVLAEPVEMAQIEITSPSSDGALQSGYVEVTYDDEDGNEQVMLIPFGDSSVGESDDEAELELFMLEEASSVAHMTRSIMSLDGDSENEVNAIEEVEAERNIVVISLGTRVVVKTITVTVEKVEGTNEYVAIETVEFVKDIVPEDPQASNGVVSGVSAKAGSESVTLSWESVPNIEGYRILYGTSSGKYSQTMNVSGTSATISGLENFSTYYFVVQSTSGDWSSSYSSQVSAKPEPTSAPSATTLLEASPFDSGATIKWQSNKNAIGYQVWVKETDSDDNYTLRATTSSTSVMIGSLENDISYSVYVTCYNNIGSSGRSNILEVVPEKENLDGPTLPVTGRLPLSAVTKISMDNTSNVKNSLYPNGWSINNVYDGDFTTDWVADVWYKSSGFTFTFDQPYDMSYMVYVSKVGGLYHQSLLRLGVAIWVEGDDVNNANGYSYTASDSSFSYVDDDGQYYCVIDFPRSEDIVQIKVWGTQWDGSYTNVSLSEVVFYEHNGIDDDIVALFANDSFTELHEDVTQADIDGLRERIDETGEYIINTSILHSELDMAQRLLDKEESIGVIATNLVSINNSKDDASLCGLSPLDFIAYGATQLTVYADIPEGETVTLYPSQYFAEAFDQFGTGIVLESGRNIINVEQLTNYSDVSKGGVVYYKYTGSKGDEITLNFDAWFKSSVRQDIWKVPVLELYDMYNLTEEEIKARIETYVLEMDAFSTNSINNPSRNPMNSTEISLRNVLLSLPATEFYAGFSGYSTTEAKVEALYNNVLAWEELLMVCNVSYGLDDWQNPREGRQNIRYMRMTDAFMYAAGDHIGIQYGSVTSLAKGQPTSMMTGSTNSLFGWGIAHEIGHNLDRWGRAEITNNIYSLLAETWDGDMGLLTSRVAGGYSSVYSKVTSGNMGISNDVFTQLAMYWQLQQAYCGENSLEFYNAISKMHKQGAYSGYATDTRFALCVAKLVEKDLTDFFTAWGVDLNDSAKAIMATYEKETKKIQYLNDYSREYRLLDGTTLTSGNYSATATSNANNLKEVNITINHDLNSAALQGFEIYRNNKLVGFTTSNSYTDNIGSINNTAISYKIIAIDKLGNVFGSGANSNQIRIEYDDVIDSSMYTVEEVEGGLKYVFKDSTTISGILSTDLSSTGDFKVYISQYSDGSENELDAEVEPDDDTTDEVESDDDTTDEVESDDVVTDEVESDEPEVDDVVPDEPEADDVAPDEVESDDVVTDEVESDDDVTNEVEPDDVVTDEPESDVVTDEPESDDVVTDEPEADDVVTDEVDSDDEVEADDITDEKESVDLLSTSEYISMLKKSNVITESKEVLPSVIIAHATIASDNGNSELATSANNLFNILSDSTWGGEVYGKDGDSFRKYESWDASVIDYLSILSTITGVANETDYLKASENLATSPIFASSGLYSSLVTLQESIQYNLLLLNPEIIAEDEVPDEVLDSTTPDEEDSSMPPLEVPLDDDVPTENTDGDSLELVPVPDVEEDIVEEPSTEDDLEDDHTEEEKEDDTTEEEDTSGSCGDSECTDPNCAVHSKKDTSGSCGDSECTDPNCAIHSGASLSSNYSAEDSCESDCDHTHDVALDDCGHTHEVAFDESQREVKTLSLSATVEIEVSEELEGFVVARTGNFSVNHIESDTKFINYFNKQGVEDDDTRIGVYDAVEVFIEGATLDDNIQFLRYIGDNVSFMDFTVGELGMDFDTGVGILEAGTIIVVGEYLGDPYFNEITMLGKFSESNNIDGSLPEYIERAFAGTTYMFGYETETVSTISDGLFLFVPDIQNEASLQGVQDACHTVSLFPVELQAVMNRTSDTGKYKTSDTIWTNVPTEDTMPLIYFD